jgi:hypothetical protein
LVLEIEENEVRFRADTWDVEVSGPSVIVRRGSGDIALILRVMPRSELIIQRLDMHYQGVHIHADERGICIGPPTGQAFGYTGEIHCSECCLEIDGDPTIPPVAGLQYSGPQANVLTNFVAWNVTGPACVVSWGGLTLRIGTNATISQGKLFTFNY